MIKKLKPGHYGSQIYVIICCSSGTEKYAVVEQEVTPVALTDHLAK